MEANEVNKEGNNKSICTVNWILKRHPTRDLYSNVDYCVLYCAVQVDFYSNYIDCLKFLSETDSVCAFCKF